MIAAFRRRQPALAIVLTVEDRTAPPIGREIDIAFAAAPIEPRGFHCRKLGEVAWAVYGAAAYLDTHPAPRRIQELGDQALIAWTAGGGPAGLRRWLRALGAEDAAVFRTDSLAAQLAAAQAGLGLAVLPCCLADGVPGLRRVFEPVKALTRPLWAATAQELRRVTRVSAFLAAAAAFIAGQRRRLAGDNVPPPAPPDRPFGP